MGSRIKRSTFFFSPAFFLLSFSQFVIPLKGFALKNACKISFNVAICSGNFVKLQDVPQDIPPTVKGFDLSTNKISRIRTTDFKEFRLLEVLDLKNNIISQVDEGAFINLRSLKKLNLNRNKLGKLDAGLFDGLQNLTELRVTRNRLKMVEPSALKSLVSLTFLDISNNKLCENIRPLFQLPNLSVLSMAGNNMRFFESGHLTNTSLQLKSLDLSRNPITVFRITADILPNLTWLNLRGTFKKRQVTWDVRTFLGNVSLLDISELRLSLRYMTSLLASVNSSLTVLRMDKMSCSLAELINISCSIPTMSALQLQNNKLGSINSSVFHLCTNVKDLDLQRNQINSTDEGAFRSMKELKVLTLSDNRLQSVPVATRNLPNLMKLDLSKNKINALHCDDFANITKLRHLKLNANLISALPSCVFKEVTKLEVLKLQNNSISQLNTAFKMYLPNLKQLHLNSNKLVAINHGEFGGLRSLQNLSLHSNQIKKLGMGSFLGLKNLTDIHLQLNMIETEQIAGGVFNDLINLRRLDLSNNHIRYYNSRPLRNPPFLHLSLLETLYIPSQRRRGRSQLPSNILKGLSNLLEFTCRNSQLVWLPVDTFSYTPRLQRLDISSNEFQDLSPALFHPIKDVRSLYISRTRLGSLEFLKDARLGKLNFLQSKRNVFSVISEDVLESLPELVYVDFQGNNFTCDCDNAGFLQWVKENNKTQVFDAYNFECNYPLELKSKKLLDLDTQSCTVNTDFICFISTTCTILLFMAMSFTYHFLRWQLTYAYYFFLALLADKKRKNQQTPRQYDAFVSYNAHDEHWVLRNLLPKLEEEQGWALCLHHRDFEPGKPIIENITDAIYGSRKTICVISRRYLESEWCSREIQVASFRLFDEQKDVLILIFLEDIPTRQLSPFYRMKKMLKSKTYLSWPRAEGHPEVFWEKLRQALLSKDMLDLKPLARGISHKV
uniref:TLR22 n=2 Tax=Takifugu rubripes TaxID=31033 RepID=Q5H723_TAKRU|nr:TLR22 [Takifugu rubripes]|eukprot:XP_011606379.1 PREDICTED: toll-like receptor 22 isoform X1 [Takifugu rubripes]